MTTPPWLVQAQLDLGVSEIKGPENNPRILVWHGYTTLRATNDETPYCSSALCAWMEQAGIESTRSAAARSWERWGQELHPDAPLPLGAVAVFWRGKRPSEGKGHVCLYVGGDPSKGRISVLGANQDDTTSIITTSTARLRCFRWPKGAAPDRPEDWLPLLGKDTPVRWS